MWRRCVSSSTFRSFSISSRSRLAKKMSSSARSRSFSFLVNGSCSIVYDSSLVSRPTPGNRPPRVRRATPRPRAAMLNTAQHRSSILRDKETQRVSGSRCWRVCAAAALSLAIVAAPSSADVAPGDRITGENVAMAKDLISPGLEWCIEHGFPITVTETKRIEWPRAYRGATEKYSGQVKLSPDGLHVLNYIAGQPFPNIDPKDPKAAMKVLWNYNYGFLTTDDVDLRNFDADTGAIADHGPMSIERHFLLDHFRRLFWTGRLYVDPKPEMPNPNGYRAQQGLYPILEPYDLKGVGALGNRYIDPARQDDSWLYLPSLRRVRRLSTSQRADALFGQDTDVDSYYGYSGHIAWMDFKYLGERELLSCYHAKSYPVKWNEKVDWAFDETWEKRHVYVIEGISKLPQYAYGKRVIFIDKEAW